MKKPVEITVMGQKLQVRSDSDERYVLKVAEYVDKKIGEVVQNTRSVASLSVAILAAMNITDEFFRFRDEKDGKFKEMEKKIQDMIELVDLQL